MVDLLVTYLELLSPPYGKALSIPAGTSIEVEPVLPAEYLALYRAVGESIQWDARTRLPQADLTSLLLKPTTMIVVLRTDGDAIGLCEFVGQGSEEVELANFGIVPAAYGRGLGPLLLDHAIRACWRENTKRIWLRTDTNDHPKAIATYERAGFKRTIQRVESFPD